MKTIPYNFYKETEVGKVYKELLGNKYSIEFWEDEHLVSIHFYFNNDGDLIINNVYKNRTNYKAPRYIKKYAQNPTLIKAMMKFNKN